MYIVWVAIARMQACSIWSDEASSDYYCPAHLAPAATLRLSYCLLQPGAVYVGEEPQLVLECDLCCMLGGSIYMCLEYNASVALVCSPVHELSILTALEMSPLFDHA